MKNKHQRNVDTLVFIFLLLSILISALALAASDDPDVKVKQTFSQIETSLIALKQQQSMSQSNVRKVLTIYLLPEIERKYFTNKVLATHVAKLSNELLQAFNEQLTQQLINSYSNLLSKYNNESIVIGKSSLSKSGKIAMVNIAIVGQEKTHNAVVKLIKSQDQQWYFFDIVVEGISLLQTKQSEMNSAINRTGADATLQQLTTINQKRAASN